MATDTNTEADTVEVGEITVQFTAHGEGATEEMDEFREELRRSVSSLEEANAVVEMYSLPDIDARLSWGRNEGDEDMGGR